MSDWQPVLRAAAALRDHALHSHEAQLIQSLQGTTSGDIYQAGLVLGDAVRALLTRLLDQQAQTLGLLPGQDSPPSQQNRTPAQDDSWTAIADLRAARRALLGIAADRALMETSVLMETDVTDSVAWQRARDELLDHPALETRPAMRSIIHSTLDRTSLRVLVLGNFKRGKSTLINALVGVRILPARMTPATAVLCTLHHAPALEITVSYVDGRPSSIVSLPELEDYVCLPDPADNPTTSADEVDGAPRRFRPEIEGVSIGLPWPFLRNGVEIIDSPGLNESTDRQARAWAALDAADIIIYVLSATEPLAADEEATIAEKLWSAGHRTVFFVVNYANRVDEEELPLIRERFATLLAPYCPPTSPLPLYFVNARPALLARERGQLDTLIASGLPALEQALRLYTTGPGRLAAQRRSQIRRLWGQTGQLLEDEAVTTVSAAMATLFRYADDRRVLTEQVAALRKSLAEAESVAAQQQQKRVIAQETQQRVLMAVGTRIAAAIDRQGKQQSLTWLLWEMPAWLTDRINEQLTGQSLGPIPLISAPPVVAMRDRGALLAHYHTEARRVLVPPTTSEHLTSAPEDQTARRARQSLNAARAQLESIDQQIAELRAAVRRTLADVAALDQAITQAVQQGHLLYRPMDTM